MKTYEIAVEWAMYGYMRIEAESLQEAVDLACDQEPLPGDSSYLDDSFRVDMVFLRDTYPDDDVVVPDRCANG